MIWVWVLQRCRAYGAGRSGGAAGTEAKAQRQHRRKGAGAKAGGINRSGGIHARLDLANWQPTHDIRKNKFRETHCRRFYG